MTDACDFGREKSEGPVMHQIVKTPVDSSRRSFTGDFCVIVIQNRGYHR